MGVSTHPAAIDADLTREDRAELARESLDSLSDTPLDRDLAHMINPAFLRPVRPLRDRRPEDVPLVYQGSRRGIKHANTASVIVPDTENAPKVMELLSTIQVWDVDGREHPTPETLHVSGPSYDFTRNETTLVHKDDVGFLLAHRALLFEHAADVHVAALPEHPQVAALKAENATLSERMERLERMLLAQADVAHAHQPAPMSTSHTQSRAQRPRNARAPRAAKETMSDG